MFFGGLEMYSAPADQAVLNYRTQSMLYGYILAALLYAGTGGVVDSRRLENVGTSFYSVSGIKAYPDALQEATVPAIVAEIQALFGLSVVDAATVLDVSRQTIYDWINGRQTPQIGAQRKLRALHDLSLVWRGATQATQETARRRFADKPQLLDALRSTDKETVVAIAAARALARAEPESIVAKMSRLGFKEKGERQQIASLDDARW